MKDEDKNPLLVFEKASKIAVACFGILFFSVNGLMLGFGESAAFQRLGSFWIAFLLLTFGALGFVIKAIISAVEGKGPFVEMTQQRLEPVTFKNDKGWMNYMSKQGVEYEKPLLSQGEILEYLKDASQRVFAIVAPNELFFAALATLQWGYGDLVHCWINGKGWTTC